jgi:hypothetical protein
LCPPRPCDGGRECQQIEKKERTIVKKFLSVVFACIVVVLLAHGVSAHTSPLVRQVQIPSPTCYFAVGRDKLFLLSMGTDERSACESVQHDLGVIKAIRALGKIHETNPPLLGTVWCKRTFPGYAVIVFGNNASIGKSFCKGFMQK